MSNQMRKACQYAVRHFVIMNRSWIAKQKIAKYKNPYEKLVEPTFHCRIKVGVQWLYWSWDMDILDQNLYIFKSFHSLFHIKTLLIYYQYCSYCLLILMWEKQTNNYIGVTFNFHPGNQNKHIGWWCNILCHVKNETKVTVISVILSSTQPTLYTCKKVSHFSILTWVLVGSTCQHMTNVKKLALD